VSRLDLDYDAVLDEQVRPVATNEISLKVDLEWHLSLDVHPSISKGNIDRSLIHGFEEAKAEGVVNNKEGPNDLSAGLGFNQFSRRGHFLGLGIISFHPGNP